MERSALFFLVLLVMIDAYVSPVLATTLALIYLALALVRLATDPLPPPPAMPTKDE